MKILFFDMGSYTYRDINECMQSMGHYVSTVYYHFSDRYNDDFFCERFTKKVNEISPDIIFSVNFFPLVARISSEKGIIYVSWSYDSPLAERLEDYFDFDTNRIWLFDRYETEAYRLKGHNNVFHCPLAVNTERISRLINSDSTKKTKYECDVSFVGNLYKASIDDLLAPLSPYLCGYISGAIESQSRLYGVDILTHTITDRIIDDINAEYQAFARTAGLEETKVAKLTKNGFIFLIKKQITYAERVTLIDTIGKMCDMVLYSLNDYPFSSKVKYKGPVRYYSEMPIVFNHSRLNLCPALRSIVTGIPLRSLDIMASEGVLIANHQPEYDEYFRDGEDLIIYDSLEEAVEKAQWYLRHDIERERIAGHAITILKKYFNYKNRLDMLLKN